MSIAVDSASVPSPAATEPTCCPPEEELIPCSACSEQRIKSDKQYGSNNNSPIITEKEPDVTISVADRTAASASIQKDHPPEIPHGHAAPAPEDITSHDSHARQLPTPNPPYPGVYKSNTGDGSILSLPSPGMAVVSLAADIVGSHNNAGVSTQNPYSNNAQAHMSMQQTQAQTQGHPAGAYYTQQSSLPAFPDLYNVLYPTPTFASPTPPQQPTTLYNMLAGCVPNMAVPTSSGGYVYYANPLVMNSPDPAQQQPPQLQPPQQQVPVMQFVTQNPGQTQQVTPAAYMNGVPVYYAPPPPSTVSPAESHRTDIPHHPHSHQHPLHHLPANPSPFESALPFSVNSPPPSGPPASDPCSSSYRSFRPPYDVDKAVTTYKTEICRSHQYNGQCEYNTNCQFAHGLDELRSREVDTKYKTEKCKNYQQYGAQACYYGGRCKFIHDEFRVRVGMYEFWLISPGENMVRVERVDPHNTHRLTLLLGLIAEQTGAAAQSAQALQAQLHQAAQRQAALMDVASRQGDAAAAAAAAATDSSAAAAQSFLRAMVTPFQSGLNSGNNPAPMNVQAMQVQWKSNCHNSNNGSNTANSSGQFSHLPASLSTSHFTSMPSSVGAHHYRPPPHHHRPPSMCSPPAQQHQQLPSCYDHGATQLHYSQATAPPPLPAAQNTHPHTPQPHNTTNYLSSPLSMLSNLLTPQTLQNILQMNAAAAAAGNLYHMNNMMRIQGIPGQGGNASDEPKKRRRARKKKKRGTNQTQSSRSTEDTASTLSNNSQQQSVHSSEGHDKKGKQPKNPLQQSVEEDMPSVAGEEDEDDQEEVVGGQQVPCSCGCDYPHDHPAPSVGSPATTKHDESVGSLSSSLAALSTS